MCCAARARLRRHPARHAQPGRDATGAADHAAHPGHRAGALRRAWAARWTPSWRSPAGTASPVVEDNAHGLFGKYKGRYLGTFGCLATQSFHETKNFTCGEGGALLINDPQYIERAEIIREKGTNRSRFFRGQVDKYTWVDIGSSYLPSDILAAFLFAQLEAARADPGQAAAHLGLLPRRICADWAAAHGVRLPVVPAHCEQPYHMFYLLLPSLEQRQALDRAPEGARHPERVPLPAAAPLGHGPRASAGKPGDCPVTEDVSDRLLRLPFYNDLTEAEQAQVVEAILGFRWMVGQTDQ